MKTRSVAVLIALVAACAPTDSNGRRPRPAQIVDGGPDATSMGADASAVDAPAVDASTVDASLIDASAVDAPRADASAVDASLSGRFVTTGTLGTPRMRHAAALLPDGRVLIVGGYALNGTVPIGSVEVFDPATATFAPVAPTTYVHDAVHATALPDGRVLVTGATIVPGGFAHHTELFDPTTMTFAPGPDALQPLVDAYTTTLLADGRVLIAGASVEVFDPATATITALPPLLVLAPAHRALRLGNGRVLLSGGPHQGSGGGGTRTDAEEFDPVTDGFVATGDMISPRASHVITELPGGGALVTGGYLGLGGPAELYETAETYDPATRAFTTTGSMAISHVAHTATRLADGRVLVAGGMSDGTGTAPDNPGAVTAAAELYSPSTRTFATTAPMATPRVEHTATRLLDGRVLIVGGSATPSAELYIP